MLKPQIIATYKRGKKNPLIYEVNNFSSPLWQTYNHMSCEDRHINY